MAVPARLADDVAAILARRHANGGDFWATADGRWGVGSPFSTFDCALMLTELGMPESDPAMLGIADCLFASWQEDGRFRPAPKGTVYPCHLANAARALCRLGHAGDARLEQTFGYLLAHQHTDGGWRCNRRRLGASAETDASNPGVTLAALDAFRFTARRNDDERLDRAVDSLLAHWESRRPLGPCAFGIGTLFNRVEYPFLRYNLFFYVYVLSFYESARSDGRFQSAWAVLRSRLVDGQVVVESPNRKLAGLTLCRRGEASGPATRRMREIEANLKL